MHHAFPDIPTSTIKRITATKLWLISKITARVIFGKEEKQYNMIFIPKKYQWVNFKESFLKLIKYSSSRHYMTEGWMRTRTMMRIRIIKMKNFKMMKMMKIMAKIKWFFKDLKDLHKTQQKIYLQNFSKKNKKSI